VGNYRNRKLLDLAHRVTECQSCGRYTEGCEPAHANAPGYGKGMGIKAHDWAHAALCHDCHAQIDQGGCLVREERREKWERAFLKTLALYWANGWLGVR
jgi:hypothetical protein